jgi:hypothetical protein
VTTEPGAVSEHWCGMSIRWTGTGTSQMQVVHDPGDARGFVFLALLALPTALALVVGGISAADLVAIGTVAALTVWRLFLLPGVLFISPDQRVPEPVSRARMQPPARLRVRPGRHWFALCTLRTYRGWLICPHDAWPPDACPQR